MGEYALYNGERVKIGTCEQMYYLRADQVGLVQGISGNVNPRLRDEAQSIRFRFPFPDEDGQEPGSFQEYDRAFAVLGVEVPEDVDHYTLKFSRSYPNTGGILLSTPCPRSKEGKASGLRFSYNGYSGPVGIHSQRLVDGQLKLVLKCMDCGAMWRVDSLEECKPVLDALEKYAADREREDRVSADYHKRNGGTTIDTKSRGNYYREIARRIIDGYTKPNYWTLAAELTPA